MGCQPAFFGTTNNNYNSLQWLCSYNDKAQKQFDIFWSIYFLSLLFVYLQSDIDQFLSITSQPIWNQVPSNDQPCCPSTMKWLPSNDEIVALQWSTLLPSNNEMVALQWSTLLDDPSETLTTFQLLDGVTLASPIFPPMSPFHKTFSFFTAADLSPTFRGWNLMAALCNGGFDARRSVMGLSAG